MYEHPTVSRRDLLKLGGAAMAATALGPGPATAQTPKRGGVFRIAHQLDPVGWDPHQTLSFATMTMLSFTHSRLMKVKAGPLVTPGTYPVEPDLAESWSQPSDTTYVFRLKRGVRWHGKPPVNGRELTADDVKYTYERFLATKGNGNKPVLEMVDRIEALDRYTVKFTLSEPFTPFLDALAATSTWIIAREAVEKFGDLKKPEAVIGTGPWMLERHEPNAKVVFVRNPTYFILGLPYVDGVEATIDVDPASRFSAWLSGKYDFGPEYQQVVRRVDLEIARPRKPGLQTADYVWFTGGYTAVKLDQEPFKDVRVRRAMGRASNWREFLEASPHAMGRGAPNPAVPAAAAEWSIPIAELTREGRELYEQDIPAAKRLLAQAGYPNGFKVPCESTAGYGPDYMDRMSIALKNYKAAGIETELRLKEYGAYIASTIYGKFEKMTFGLRGAWLDPDAYLYRAYMPGQPLNAAGVDDPRLTEMIKLQRRTADPAKRRDIIWDIQRHVAHHAYYLYDASQKVVSAWEPYVRNWAPNNGFDYGGRMLAAWLDR
ncbi:MAG TPA: ABC transporter substrate-binding protein [Methylomirabilota bacterium]|nr:ABC transporter substrate-binding protein [Methylomirabilota bacterium]